MRALLLRLSSHRLARWLIGLLALAVMLGGSLPQRPRLSPDDLSAWETEWGQGVALLDGLQLSHIFGAWWFDALCLLLMLNLLLGTLTCLRRRLGEARTCARPLPQALGLWGSPLAHLGMLIMLGGAYLSALGGFGAHLELSEGELFSGEAQKLRVDRGRYTAGQFKAALRLDRVGIELREGGHLRDLQLELTHQKDGGQPRRMTLETNAPFGLGGYRFFPNNRFGYSALCERRLADGERRLLLVNFAVPRAEWGQPWRVDNRRSLTGADGPNYYRLTLHGPESPVLALAVSRGPKELFSGHLEPGQSAEIGAETLTFIGIRPWAGLYMAADPGQPWFFAGLLLMLGGFVLHLAHRRIRQGDGNA